MTARLDRTGPALLGGPGRSAWSAHGSSPVRRASAPLAVGALGLAAVTYLAVTDPYRPGGHLACPILALTGWYCAGCGAQRAVHSLAHADLAAAWDVNPLAVLLAPLLVVAWARWLRRRWRGDPLAPAALSSGTRTAAVQAWGLLAVVIVFAVLRNVPVLAPWLAP